MPVQISYINARGEETILDDTERTFLGELYGREGLEAPSLEYTEVQYGDGSTDVIAATFKPRDVTLYFWAKAGTPHLREKLEEIKGRLIQIGSRDGDWGKLKICRPDGRILTLNCLYTKGLDEFVRESWSWVKFALTFHAEDPLFYDNFEYTWSLRRDDRGDYLFMATDLFMSPDLYMRSAQTSSSAGLYFNGDKAYPLITLNGPAQNISITNSATGKKIQLASDVELEPDERIYVWTQPRQRKIRKKDKNGVYTNLMGKLSADSTLDWYLVRGNNPIVLNNSATTQLSWLKFTYREGYLSAE